MGGSVLDGGEAGRPQIGMHAARNRARGVAAVLLALVAAIGGARAQEVQIECLSFPKAAVETIELLVGKGKTVPVTLQSHAFSAPLKVPRLAGVEVRKERGGPGGKVHVHDLRDGETTSGIEAVVAPDSERPDDRGRVAGGGARW